MLVLYEPYAAQVPRDISERLFDARCKFYGTDLKAALDVKSHEDFEHAVAAACRACTSLNIPVVHHIKKIFRSSALGMVPDYRLSKLGCFLVAMHIEPSYPAAARAQLSFILTDNQLARDLATELDTAPAT